MPVAAADASWWRHGGRVESPQRQPWDRALEREQRSDEVPAGRPERLRRDAPGGVLGRCPDPRQRNDDDATPRRPPAPHRRDRRAPMRRSARSGCVRALVVPATTRRSGRPARAEPLPGPVGCGSASGVPPRRRRRDSGGPPSRRPAESHAGGRPVPESSPTRCRDRLACRGQSSASRSAAFAAIRPRASTLRAPKGPCRAAISTAPSPDPSSWSRRRMPDRRWPLRSASTRGSPDRARAAPPGGPQPCTRSRHGSRSAPASTSGPDTA